MHRNIFYDRLLIRETDIRAKEEFAKTAARAIYAIRRFAPTLRGGLLFIFAEENLAMRFHDATQH